MKSLLVLFALVMSFGSCTRVPMEAPPRPATKSPVVSRLIARPEAIRPGEKVVLTWNTRNAPDILLEESADAAGGAPAEFLHEVGRFPANGSHEVWPKVTTRYVISCGDEQIGCAAASVTVLVK